MNTNSSLNKEQIDKIIDVLKLSDEDAQTIFENATSVLCKRDPHVQYEIDISFSNQNNARILMDASYPNHMRLFLDVYDEKVSFCTGEFINQSDGYNFLQTKLKELSQLDGLASQNKEFLVSTALKLNKDEIITFTSDVIDVKVFYDQLDIKLENDRSVSLISNQNSKRLSEYDISISDGKNEEIFLPTFSNNEYAFRVLEEIKNMPMSEIEKNLQRFADGEKTLLLSKALDVDESKISGFSHQIEDLKIYDSQDSTSIRFKLGDKEISIETIGENYSIWVDGKHLDSYPDGKYIAAELEELANKLELEHKAETDFAVE